MPKKKRNSKANKTKKGNRKYKDSVFIGYLTEKPERLLSLSEVSEIMKLTWSHKGEIEYEREQAETRGIAIGEARGISIGEANGKILGVNLITKMNAWLSKSNRSDELTRSFEDSALQQKLLAEYQKTHPAVASIN